MTDTTSTTALRERGTAGYASPRADGERSEGQIIAAPAPLPERGPPPERSLEQRTAALKKANRIRSARAEIKRQLGAGRKTFEQLFDEPACATMKVVDALLAMPKVGRVKANRALTIARVSPSKTIAGLSTRQRRELTNAVTTPRRLGYTADLPEPVVAPIHSVPQPRQRGRRARGLDDLLADIRRAR
jgi:hypothetical protein